VAKLGGSERQLEDVAGIVSIQSGKLDLKYIDRWVRELGLAEQWKRARERKV
jgi:hypothetical protein